MKKKILITCILTILLFVFSAYVVQAHNVELDPNSYISMPSSIYNGKGTITISSSAGTGYTLYYQKVDISDSVYTQIKNINTEAQDYNNSEKTSLTNEKANVTTLQNEYNQLKNDSNATQEQINEAYQKYSDAVTAYNTHVSTYNAKISEYNTKINELIPTYQENNWTQTTGTSSNVSLDFSGYSGQVNFALWAKLVTSSGTYYDVDCYSSNVTSTTTISLDKTTASIEISKTLKLTATTNSSKTITWSSSKENIATVDSNGNVKAIAEGVTVITATVDGKSATCTVTVTKASSESNKNDSTQSNFSNAQFSYSAANFSNLKITMSNFTTKENCRYYMYISKSKSENITSLPSDKSSITMNDDGTATISYASTNATKILEYSGTNYIYIIEEDYINNTYNIVLKAKEMPEIEMPGLGQRLDIWLYDTSNTMVSNKIYMSTDRTITYKIGKITSNDILKSFKNDSSSVAYANLLKYAKSANYMKEGTITTDGLDYNLVKDLNIEKGGYYFVYMIADNQSGKYVDVEDVAIYIENNDSSGNALIHFDFADINVDDDSKTPAQDNTVVVDTKLPQTGVSYVTVIAILVIISCGIVFYIKYKKYKDIK